jgi:hypothetical protein
VALSKLADEQVTFDIAKRYEREAPGESWDRVATAAQLANDRLAQVALASPTEEQTLAETAFKRGLMATEEDITVLAADAEGLTAAMKADLAL